MQEALIPQLLAELIPADAHGQEALIPARAADWTGAEAPPPVEEAAPSSVSADATGDPRPLPGLDGRKRGSSHRRSDSVEESPTPGSGLPHTACYD